MHLSLKELSNKLNNDFIRVHKSYIIPVNHIKTYDSKYIILEDVASKIPIGNTFRSGFFNLLAAKNLKNIVKK